MGYQVEHLAAESSIDGSRARVRLTRAGASSESALVHADAAELGEFQEPGTEWRIAGG